MTDDLKISIEELYSVFSKYPLRSVIEGCPCCVSDKDKSKIHTKPLRLLEEGDLSRYTSKAMTTWGHEEDFKHFLPRIFELLSTTDFIVDTFIVLGKLPCGEWENWPYDEQHAIRKFLLDWWSDVLMHKDYFDKEIFFEIYKLMGDIDVLLDRWDVSFENNGFRNYIDLMYEQYHDVVEKVKSVDRSASDKLLIWLKDQSQILEKGFFYYESRDYDFATKISDTLYMVERVNF